MLRATRIHSHIHGSPADVVVLDHDARHRRRMAMTGQNGLAFLLDLAEAEVIRDGAALILEDGREVLVEAAAEPLAELTPSDPAHAIRLAWHLGNRHLPTMFDGGAILIRRDHVIEAMALGLGASVRHVQRPFDPESGAYAAGGHGHSHGHGHGHGHGHDHHSHDHPHDHEH
jgi:urease accessory protein